MAANCRTCQVMGAHCVNPGACPHNRTYEALEHQAADWPASDFRDVDEAAVNDVVFVPLPDLPAPAAVVQAVQLSTPAKFNDAAARLAIRALLVAIGEDPDREGLAETPRRVAAMWREFMAYAPGKLGTTFTAEQTDQMVVVGGMRVWSMCEHHLLPFWCDVAVGYLAQDKVIGLSKIGRVAHKHAKRLQLQERLVAGIADELAEILGHDNVAVIARGEHLCMTSRGIATPHFMTSSAISGAFRDPAARAEFLSLANQR